MSTSFRRRCVITLLDVVIRSFAMRCLATGAQCAHNPSDQRLELITFTMLDLTDVYNQTAALLVLAAALGVLAVSLKQPVLIAFIAAGILAGPSGFGWIQNPEQVHLLAELGLALLLFLVGLKLDIHVIRTMGPVALAVGLGQVAFTAAGGYLLAMVLGLSIVPALYIAVALTFSSTIIIVKLLSDQNESETLHGRIALGILIVQDMLVVAVIIGLSAFAVVGKQDIGLLILQMVAKGAALMAAIGIFSILVLPRLLDRLARSPELLLLFAITWAAALACVTNELGFSKEVGAFLAGIAIASTQYREILAAKLVSVRDFLLLFFFIDLGTRLNLGQLGAQVWTSIILSAFVLIGNPLIVLAIMGFMGYRRRTGFLAGMTVAQISEFSLILGAMGVKLGHINSEAMGIITLVGLITIGLSTYMIIYSHELYRIFGPYLKIFERSNTYREQQPGGAVSNEAGADVILFGCGRYGTSIADNLRLQGRQVLGVDFDPQAVRVWREKGRDAWFGDADDAEFLALLPTSRAKWVISSVGERNINLNLLKSLQSSGYRGSAALTARVSTDVELLQDAGADLVFYPFVDAAAEAVDMICLAEEKERRKRMDKQIDGLSGHYIVCGYGRMGQQIVSDLQNHGLPYVVVESNPEQLPGLITGDILYVEGKATDDETLIRAGVRKAKSLIAVNPTEEENVFIVLTARGLNAELFIVARSIRSENEDKLKRAGADKVMSPYILGGRRMAAAVMKPRVMDFLDLIMHSDNDDLEISDLQVTEKCPFAHKTLEQARIRQVYKVTVLAIKRLHQEALTANPDPAMTIEEGDELIVMGTPADLDAMEAAAKGS